MSESSSQWISRQPVIIFIDLIWNKTKLKERKKEYSFSRHPSTQRKTGRPALRSFQDSYANTWNYIRRWEPIGKSYMLQHTDGHK